MMRSPSAHRQRGATLVVGMIMLALITLLLTSSFTMSSTNLKSVSNMQVRNEAVAAANKAIEQVLSSPFSASPAGESINVDLNNDNAADYTVVFTAPACVSATVLPGSGAPPSSVKLGTGFSVVTSTYYRTVWDLNATVTDAITGSNVRVHQGVRVLLTQAQYNTVCST